MEVTTLQKGCTSVEILFLIGRVLFSGLFLVSGLNHVMQLDGMAQYAQSKRIPMPKVAVAGSGALLVAGGLSVLLGIYPSIGLTLLLVFLVPTTLVMHNFWVLEDERQKQMERVNFMKNLALAGTCLMLLIIERWPLAWWNL